MLELWQADIGAFGRLPTDEQGACVFESVKPGCVGRQAPHVNVSVFARGLLKQAQTRMYFPDEEANASDPVLQLVPEEDRDTLVAREEDGVLRFDIHLQGEQETVFFDF